MLSPQANNRLLIAGLVALFSLFIITVLASGFSVGFYLVLVVVGLAVSSWRPAVGLTAAIALALVFAQQFTLQSIILDTAIYKFYLVDILLLGVYIGLLIRALAGQIKWRWRWVDSALLLFIVAVIIVAVVSWLNNGGQALIISGLKNYGFYPLLYYGFYLTMADINNRRDFWRWSLLGSLAITIFFAYGLITGRGLWTDITPLSTPGSRLLDFGHAFYWCLAIICGLTYWFYNQRAKYWPLLAAIYAVGVVGSLMRHLWLAAALTAAPLLYIAWRDRPRRWRQIGWLGLWLTAAVISGSFLLLNVWPNASWSQTANQSLQFASQRLISLNNSQDSSLAWRGAVWQNVWASDQAQVFWGWGLGRKIFVEMPGYLDYVEIRDIHNSWLALLVQLGVLPWALLLTVIAWLLWRLVKLRHHAPGLAMGLAGVITFCLIAFLFQPYLEANLFNIFFWAALGLARCYVENPASQQI